MELRINLATASLKDAEHAMFIIGAYFGMTNLPHVPAGNARPVGELVAGNPPARVPESYDLGSPGSGQERQTFHGPGGEHAGMVVSAVPLSPSLASQVVGTVDSDPTRGTGDPYLDGIAARDAAATVFAAPATLPPDAGETPMAADPAQVFAGNVAGAAPAAGTPTMSPATAAPSAPIAAAPVGMPPAPPPVPAASAPPGVEVDATGLPWDARIHASGEGGAKPKNADGKWRKKRGLNDAALIARIEQELRNTMTAPTLPAAPSPVPATPYPQPPAPPVAPPTPLPPAPPSADPQTFEQLMPRVTAAVIAKTIPTNALQEAVAAYALPNVPALAHRPDMVPSVWVYLKAQYPALV